MQQALRGVGLGLALVLLRWQWQLWLPGAQRWANEWPQSMTDSPQEVVQGTQAALSGQLPAHFAGTMEAPQEAVTWEWVCPFPSVGGEAVSDSGKWFLLDFSLQTPRGRVPTDKQSIFAVTRQLAPTSLLLICFFKKHVVNQFQQGKWGEDEAALTEYSSVMETCTSNMAPTSHGWSHST